MLLLFVQFKSQSWMKFVLKSTMKDDEVEETKDELSPLWKFKGILAASTDVLMMVISVTCVQLLERKVPDFELNTIRQITGVVFFFFVSIVTGEGYLINKCEIFGTLCLGFLSFLTSICIFIAVTYIPLSNEKAFEMTSTIISGIILFAIFWKENSYFQKHTFCIFMHLWRIFGNSTEFYFQNKRWRK